MPCRCDDYDITAEQRRELEHEHNVRCQAQSLAHKLGKLLEENGVGMPPRVATLLEQHRKALLSHKRTEHNKDITNIQRLLDRAKGDCQKIRSLGGEPTADKLQVVMTLEGQVAELKQVTDAQLLG